MAFDDYKDLLPSTRVYSMSELRKQATSEKNRALSSKIASMSDRTAQYMEQMRNQHPQHANPLRGPATTRNSSTREVAKNSSSHKRDMPRSVFEDYMGNQALSSVGAEQGLVSVRDNDALSRSHSDYEHVSDYNAMLSYDYDDSYQSDDSVVSAEMWGEYERSLASQDESALVDHHDESDLVGHHDESHDSSQSQRRSSEDASAPTPLEEGLQHKAKAEAQRELTDRDLSDPQGAAQYPLYNDGQHQDTPERTNTLDRAANKHVDNAEAVHQGQADKRNAGSYSLDKSQASSGDISNGASDEELDFSSIMEAYEEFQSESDSDESYLSLRGKDLSGGKARGSKEDESTTLYYPSLRATDSTSDFTDEIAPLSDGLPDELKKFLKDRPQSEEDAGPKYSELENQRAREAAEEHSRITADGRRRLSILESTAQWNTEGQQGRRPATGIKYSRNSYMKPRGAEEREHYTGPRKDFGLALKELLDRIGIRIERIEDRNYQKLCFLETRLGDPFKLSVFYNKKELVTFIQTSSELEDAKEAFSLLKNLAGSSIHNIELKSDIEAQAYQQETERNSNKLLQRNKTLKLVDAKKAEKAVQNNKVDAKGSAEAGMGTVVKFERRMHNILDPLGFIITAISDKNYQKQLDITTPSGNQLKLAVYYKGNDKISSFKFNKMPTEDMEVLKLCLQSFEAQLLNTTLDLFKAKSMKRTLHAH